MSERVIEGVIQTLKDLRPEQLVQVKHKCFNGTIYKKEKKEKQRRKKKKVCFLIRLTAATIEQVH